MDMREQHKEKLEAAFSSMLEAAFETFDGEPKQEGLVIMAIFDLFEATVKSMYGNGKGMTESDMRELLHAVANAVANDDKE